MAAERLSSSEIEEMDDECKDLSQQLGLKSSSPRASSESKDVTKEVSQDLQGNPPAPNDISSVLETILSRPGYRAELVPVDGKPSITYFTIANNIYQASQGAKDVRQDIPPNGSPDGDARTIPVTGTDPTDTSIQLPPKVAEKRPPKPSTTPPKREEHNFSTNSIGPKFTAIHVSKIKCGDMMEEIICYEAKVARRISNKPITELHLKVNHIKAYVRVTLVVVKLKLFSAMEDGKAITPSRVSPPEDPRVHYGVADDWVHWSLTDGTGSVETPGKVVDLKVNFEELHGKLTAALSIVYYWKQRSDLKSIEPEVLSLADKPPLELAIKGELELEDAQHNTTVLALLWRWASQVAEILLNLVVGVFCGWLKFYNVTY